tara:strand:- start:298 stop:1191 length:894 start_codon:yes stop_codon:yes gene_type:complete
MKKICIIGSSGFIGKNIYDKLIRNNEFKIIRYSSLENKFLDYNLDDSFDILIFCSGLHPHVDQKIKGIFLKNKEILRKCKKLFFLSKKIIFFSSFKTSFNKNSHHVKFSNKYNFYEFDSEYGKSKIILEKIFLKICNKFKKRYIIISPTHVIGPNDCNLNPNNKFLLNISKKKIILYPNVNIPLIDVRNLSNFVEDSILNDTINNQKVIVNDSTIKLKKYIQIAKQGTFYISLSINLKLLIFINNVLNFLGVKLINKSRAKYIEINPIVDSNKIKNQYTLEQTIKDTIYFFKNKKNL